MLPRLPQGIIIMISRYLNFYSKLNLAKTCEKLNYTLCITVLYEKLVIPSKQTDEVLLFFKKKPVYGSRVKTCYLRAAPSNQTLLIQLSSIFPKLTKLLSRRFKAFNSEVIATGCLEGLKNTLQECDDNFYNVLLKLVTRYEFPELTKIAASNVSGFGFGFLQYTPSLISLKVTKLALSIVLLGNLHDNCPQLKYLTLDNFDSGTNSISHSSVVEPVYNTETFTIDDHSERNYSCLVILEYVVKKYPNLKRLQLHLRGQLNHNEDRTVNDIPLTVMSTMLSQIQFLSIRLCMFSNITNTIDLAVVKIRNLAVILTCPDHLKLFTSTQGRSGIFF